MSSFPRSFNTADLNSRTGLEIERSTRGAGDINGDGIGDFLVSNTTTGDVDVVFGSRDIATDGVRPLTGSGANGFSVDGSKFRLFVDAVGDVNGDGIDDLVAGAVSSATHYLILGSRDKFDDSISLSTLDDSRRFIADVNGRGLRFTNAGDVNGDGFGDILASGFNTDPNESYVLFGGSNGFSQDFNRATLNGSNGFIISSSSLDAGSFTTRAGDINGDGFDDLAVQVPDRDEGYVVLGSGDGFGSQVDLSTLIGSSGFVFNGTSESQSGNRLSISSVGDINGDGLNDIALGSSRYSSSYDRSYGRYLSSDTAVISYVVFGSRDGFGDSFELSTLDGLNGFAIDNVGVAVSSAGDINGDGIDDVLASGSTGFGGGRSYVIFGTRDGFSDRINPFSLDREDGFVIKSEAADFASVIANIGDVNGDGLDDVIVSGFRGGFVVFGRIDGISVSVPSGAIAEGTTVTATITRTTSTTDDLVVSFENSDASELAVPPTVTIAAGETQASFDITAISDRIVDGDQAVILTATATTTAGRFSLADVPISVIDTSKPEILSPFPNSFELSELDGSNGFAINGISAGNRSGGSVRGAGDVNGDGFDDVIISVAEATNATRENSVNQIYVVFGSGDGFNSSIELADLDGTNGFAIDGNNEKSSIYGRNAGDVNGDGFDDLLIGAGRATVNGKVNAGQSHIVFGSGDGFNSSLKLSALDGSNGFTINGIEAYDYAGLSVSAAGDVNGDGFDDVVIGAQGDRFEFYGSRVQSESYVVFGSGDGFSKSLELSDLDGSNGFILEDGFNSNYFGFEVDGIGDIDGDGFDDISIGHAVSERSYYSRSYPSRSSQYIVLGSGDGFDERVSLSKSYSRSIFGNSEVGFFSIDGAGDVNGDGLDDMIVGIGSANANGKSRAGLSYVLFGADDNFDTPFRGGFTLNGFAAGDFSGKASSAGDVNNDGFDDVIIGASGADPNGKDGAGRSYIVFGSDSGLPVIRELAGVGFTINGISAGDVSGSAVDGAGDVNGDGIDDVIIGARDADPNGKEDAGQSYVVFGLAELSFSLAENRLAEGASTIGTVTRNTEDTSELVVPLVSSDPTALSVPATITFLAGQREATFEAIAVDNTLSTGTQTQTVSAAEPSLTSGSARIEILDNDVPSLTLSLDADTIAENGSTTGTLTRNSNINTPFTVTLSSSEPSAATVPEQVTFAANQQQVTFTISGVDEGLLDDTQIATISVAASGFANPIQASLSVTGATTDETIFVDASNTIRGNAFFVGLSYRGRLLSSTDNSDISPDDIIAGTQGDDSIWAGRQGNDSVSGNGGNDIIGIGSGSSTVITAEGDDFVYSITSSSGDNVIELGEGNNNVWLLGGDNRISAGSGRNVIGLGTGADVVRILGGNNVIYRAASGSRDGNKDIVTGAGEDYMELGTGDDLIDAGGGLNTLFGGAGADTFVVRRGAYNFLGDFELGIDKINLIDIGRDTLSFFQGTGEKANSVFGFVGFEAVFEVVDATAEQLNTDDVFI